MNEARNLRQLKKLPLVQSLDEALWDTLSPTITFRELAEGETLFTAGTRSDQLYIIISGELNLFMPMTGEDSYYLQSRGKGETAGDFAALNGTNHLVSAEAAKRTRVAMLPRVEFEKLTNIDSSILAHVYDVAAELSRRVTLARVYLDLLGEMTRLTLELLLEATSVAHYRSGQVLFHEGDEADGLYVLVSGRLKVSIRPKPDQLEAPARALAEIHAPDVVGEFALIGDDNRSATVTAARESTVACLTRSDFDRIVLPRSEMLLQLSRLVVRRHVDSLHKETQKHREHSFVLVPLDDKVPIRQFVPQLMRSMREIGTTLSLSSQGFDRLYGKRGTAQTSFLSLFNSAVSEWLDDKENRFDALLYVADLDWNDWTRRCVNRADRIIFVADATADPDVRAIERLIASSLEEHRADTPTDLLLLHPADTHQPKGTARWLDPRNVHGFHHVRRDDPMHLARIARRLRGKAKAIVFSGGGARGYAHLGVQQLIEERNIPIDYIGGASMGALLGASMALGQSVQHVRELSAIFANRKALYDYTLPLVSLMRSNKLSRFCESVYGGYQIEDLWIPYFAVSTNLADGHPVIHDRGSLWKAIRCTISIPGIFSPVPTPAGDLLIDGAVLNNFPVEIMKDKLDGPGYLIGVNVGHIPELFHHYAFDTSLSGWKVLMSRLNPFQPTIQYPRIIETLLRSNDIKSLETQQRSRQGIDLLIEPDVRSIALMAFRSYDAISRIGYEEALRRFRQEGL